MNIIVVNQYLTESGAAPAAPTFPALTYGFSHGMSVPVYDATVSNDEADVGFVHGMPAPVVYTSGVSLNDLVSYWKLTESSGTRFDFFGSNDLTDNNTVGQATSLTGVPYTEGADFESSNFEYLSVSDNAGLRPSEFSFACWVNLESLLSVATIAGKDDYSSNSNREWLLDYESGAGRFNLYVFYNTSGGYDVVTANTFGAASTGTWYFVAGYVTSSEIGISVNGGAFDTQNTTSSPRNTSASTNFAIGARYNTSAVDFFDGKGVGVGFWGRKLSSAEFAALADDTDPFYDQFTVVSKESLVSFWKLDEASGTRSDAFGSSDLTDNNTVGQATGLTNAPYAEAADLIEANSEYFSRADEVANQFGDEDFTIACWVKMDTGGAAPLVSKWTSVSNNRSYTLQATSRHGGDVFEFVVSSDGNLSSEGTNWEWVGDLGGYSTGTWYFLVCGHDSVNNEIFFSQNDGTMQTTAWSAGVNTGSNVFEIGRYFEGITQLSDGTFGPVMMFRRVLSAAEITALANKDDPFYDQF